MQRLRYTLPPPSLLITFEACGRLLSFTKAATELNISRVAVSQQMRTLEDFVGLQLFHRLHRALKLTTAGERYHRTVAGALDQILQSTVALKEGLSKV
jgi:LysR family glycine cleavage system transcriptional activator